MSKAAFRYSIFFLTLAIAWVEPVQAMKCGNRLVSIGDTKAEVVAKCGEPFFADLVATEITSLEGSSGQGSVEVAVEQWTYDPGPKRFMQLLTFRAGVLEKIESGNRVPVSDTPEASRFSADTGDSQAEILRKNGEPLLVETIAFEITGAKGQENPNGVQGSSQREEKVERWTYSLGPGSFLRLLTFKGGRLVSVETGDRQ